jgi:L-alanine-DL-glutamate epimerase-like enolase superfamily enzyme
LTRPPGSTIFKRPKEAIVRIEDITFTTLDVLFTEHANRHLGYWLPHWRIVEICEVTLTGGTKGLGETIPNYTWAKVPEDILDRALGQRAADLMWDDTIGAGLQMALFDAVGRALDVSVHSLLGNRIRDWCPISWWNMDMPPEGWAEECRQAVAAGYTSAKLKARPWYDLHASIQAVTEIVPPGFHLDLDYNATLANSANAIPHLKELERYPEVAMIESPIPQSDVAGNRQIRNRCNRPIAMHFGSPPVETGMREDVADGFVVCAGATGVTKQAAIADAWNKPFWLQLVGTGITTAWAAHLGAVLPQAKWPAITCMNIWSEQLITQPHVIRGGFYAVPDGPGLGVQLDAKAFDACRSDHDWIDPPRHLYRYVRGSGETTDYTCSKQELHHTYPKDAQPISEPGSRLDVIEDDGSEAFDQAFSAAQTGRNRKKVP